MPKELANGKPTTRRYSSEEKAAAVRMVRTLRAELGVTQYDPHPAHPPHGAEVYPARRTRAYVRASKPNTR